ITAKRVLIALREDDGAAHLAGVFSERRHVRELLAIGLDSSEVLIYPDNNVPVLSRLRKFMEPVKRVEQCLPAGDNGVHIYFSPAVPKEVERIVFENVVPEREECRRPVVNDKGCAVLIKKTIH